jgi:hypothetical protein
LNSIDLCPLKLCCREIKALFIYLPILSGILFIIVLRFERLYFNLNNFNTMINDKFIEAALDIQVWKRRVALREPG